VSLKSHKHKVRHKVKHQFKVKRKKKNYHYKSIVYIKKPIKMMGFFI
jgi:hypothetical protein